MHCTRIVPALLLTGCFAESPNLPEDDGAGSGATDGASESGADDSDATEDTGAVDSSDGPGDADADADADSGADSGEADTGASDTGDPNEVVLFDFYSQACGSEVLREGYDPSIDTAPVPIECQPPGEPHGGLQALGSAMLPGGGTGNEIVLVAPVLHDTPGELSNIALITTTEVPLAEAPGAVFRTTIACPPGKTDMIFVQARPLSAPGGGEVQHDCSGPAEPVEFPLGDTNSPVVIFVGLDPVQDAVALLIAPRVVLPDGA